MGLYVVKNSKKKLMQMSFEDILVEINDRQKSILQEKRELD
jgi:hypothetical protein